MIVRLKHPCLAAAALFFAPAVGQTTETDASCQRRDFEGTGYIVCKVDPRNADLQLFWKDKVGKPYRSFATLRDAVQSERKRLVFAMNAGMYSDDFTPVGLYVETGRELVPVNTREVKGTPSSIPNFYKTPNGVFFLDDTGAHIQSTTDYLRRVSEKHRGTPLFATQSGPMLVIAGRLHPALIEGSTDRTRRSGVAICEGGMVHFAISEKDVNFHDFARLFRDGLNCRDALFLDGGNGAGLFDPTLKRADWSWHGGYGPMFGLVE